MFTFLQHRLKIESRGMRLCNNAYIPSQFKTMSLIKNAYVCVIDGEPELFETMQDAEEYAMTLAYAWHDAGANPEEEPLLAVMSVTNWFQAQDHLAQLAV